jgi:hypothetical protein
VRLAAALLASAAVLLGVVLPSTAAHAAEVPSAITGVTLDKTAYGYNERQKLTFTWSVPDSASAGDTFTLALPPELTVVSQAPFVLRDAAGVAVADAVWQKQTDGSYDIVFTLTGYADTHDHVGGTGFVATQWNHSVVTTTGGPVRLDFDGVAVEVTIDPKPVPTPPCAENCPPPPPVATSRSLRKSGGWADGSFEGTRDADDNINWTVALPGNTTGYAGPVDVADTPAAGSVIDCATVKITTQDGLASGTPKSTLDPSRYTLDCDPAGFDLTLDRIAANEFVTVTYKGTITDQDAGRFGNHVAFTAPGVTSTKDSTMVRTSQGGDGGGLQSVSVGDVVWFDADKDGLQDPAESGFAGVTLDLTGPDGASVVTVGGTPVAPVVTDAHGHYLFEGLPTLPAGQHYTVTIDQAASADALAGMVASPQHAGADTAVDSSTASAESGDLPGNGDQDLTLDFGFYLPDLPTDALPPATSEAAQLAHTGVDGVVPAAALAGGLIVLGMAGFALSRRRTAPARRS